VGGRVTEKVDVRFICASNKDPLKEVEAGRFREDLYYRLHVIPLHLPPLRERDEDVVVVARHFLNLYAREEGKRFQDFAPEVEAVLRAYAWPGNVRQLQNVLRNIIVLNDGETVTLEMLPPPLNHAPAPGNTGETAPRAATPAPDGGAPGGIRPLWQVEKDTIEAAIRLCQGNIPKAATHLGISASTIYRKRMSWQAGEGG
ncbi:MAG: helix-turn-helix domain-containing protein, partial [Alphaproteobacteria bacterium]